MITAQTTLAELEFEARKRGVTYMACQLNSNLGVIVGLQVNYTENFIQAHGSTVPEAFAVAFDRLDRAAGKELVKPQPDPPTVGPRR